MAWATCDRMGRGSVLLYLVPSVLVQEDRMPSPGGAVVRSMIRSSRASSQVAWKIGFGTMIGSTKLFRTMAKGVYGMAGLSGSGHCSRGHCRDWVVLTRNP